MIAKTTIPRISNTTPVLLTIETSRTPKMLSSVVLIRMMAAIVIWVGLSLASGMPSPLRSGIRTIGTVTSTAVTVSTPANR